MAQLLIDNNNFNNNSFNSNGQQSPSMIKSIESPSSDQNQVTQKNNNKTALCGICMKDSFKDELISCSVCGLGGNSLFLNCCF